MKNLNILIVFLLLINTGCGTTKKRANCEAYHSGNPNAYKKTKPYNKR
jgi:hypothetical protein